MRLRNKENSAIMFEKVFSSFILFSVAAGCFMTIVEVKNQRTHYEMINICLQAQERNDDSRPRHVVEDRDCKYSFSPNGQCYIEYEGPERPGVTAGVSINHNVTFFHFISSGSCLSLAYGGDCLNVPPECKTCQDIEIGDAIKNLSRKKNMFLSKFLGVRF